MNNQHRHNLFIFKGKLFAQVINLSVKRDNLVNMYVVEFSDHEDTNVFSWLFYTQYGMVLNVGRLDLAYTLPLAKFDMFYGGCMKEVSSL